MMDSSRVIEPWWRMQAYWINLLSTFWAGTEASPAAFTTTTTASTTTVTAGKRIDYNDDYYYDDSEDRPYRADVIDAAKPLAVR